MGGSQLTVQKDSIGRRIVSRQALREEVCDDHGHPEELQSPDVFSLSAIGGGLGVAVDTLGEGALGTTESTKRLRSRQCSAMMCPCNYVNYSLLHNGLLFRSLTVLGTARAMHTIPAIIGTHAVHDILDSYRVTTMYFF